MNTNWRYLKKVTGWNGISRAKYEGRRAAEDMVGQNHYPVGSARYQAWEDAYEATMVEIDDYFHESGRDDLSDDGDALASAGWGTDEDYGYYGDNEDY